MLAEQDGCEIGYCSIKSALIMGIRSCCGRTFILFSTKAERSIDPYVPLQAVLARMFNFSWCPCIEWKHAKVLPGRLLALNIIIFLLLFPVSTYGGDRSPTIPRHICQKTPGCGSARTPRWISISPRELCPISAEQTTGDDGGAEGTARCASTANGKCHSLSQARNNK